MITYQKNEFVLQFDEEHGMIHSLNYKGREYVGEKTAVFRVAFRDYEGEQIFSDVDDMKFISCQNTENAFEAVYENEDVKVFVLAEISEHIEWKIVISPKNDYVVEWVNFPQIVVPNDLGKNKKQSKILWGFNEGAIVDDLEYKESGEFKYRDLQYPSISSIPMYPGIVESQFIAYYNHMSGLYFGAHDKDDNIKGIDFYPYKKGIMLQIRHFCGGNYGETYEMSFPMVMQFFQGEWQDAAQIYKDWFTEYKGEGFVKIEENPTLPEWYSQSPIVITYPVRGAHDGDIMNPNKMFPYCAAMKHVERLENELKSRIMVILMHWEGTAPWAPPYVWPPYGGEEELKKFIDELHARGDVLGVYCSGIGWTQYSKLVENYNKEDEFEEKNLAEVMCLSPKQELPYCEIVPQIRAGYDMCPSQEFTIEVMKQQVNYMVNAGIDYIQLLDQNHGGTSYFCYSKNHGHPPVPGKWQVDAVKKLLATVEEGIGNVLIGCESAAAESYIPYLLFNDNRFELNYGVGKPVPLYSYLYHEYINNYMGNQVNASGWLDPERSPISLFERMAYAFSAGDLITLVLDEHGEVTWHWGWRVKEYKPNQKDVLEFARNLNVWRREKGKKYLHTGSMVKPYKIICEQNEISGFWGHMFHIDKIHTSAWRSSEGTVGQFLINYNPETVECEICLPDGRHRLYDDTDGFMELSGGYQKLSIKRFSAIMIEIGENTCSKQ